MNDKYAPYVDSLGLFQQEEYTHLPQHRDSLFQSSYAAELEANPTSHLYNSTRLYQSSNLNCSEGCIGDRVNPANPMVKPLYMGSQSHDAPAPHGTYAAGMY